MVGRREIQEKFGLKKCLLFFLHGAVEILVLNLHFGVKKYLTKIIFQVRFQRATVNSGGGKETRHRSHRNFWNLLTKVGGVERRKFGPIPQFSDFRSTVVLPTSIKNKKKKKKKPVSRTVQKIYMLTAMIEGLVCYSMYILAS